MPYLVENSDSLMVLGDTEGVLGIKRIEKALNQLESDGYLLTFVSDGYFVFYKQGGWGGSTLSRCVSRRPLPSGRPASRSPRG